jgi:hypothetical protein
MFTCSPRRFRLIAPILRLRIEQEAAGAAAAADVDEVGSGVLTVCRTLVEPEAWFRIPVTIPSA